MDEDRSRRRSDALVALGAGLVAFAVYLRTLYPGLNGIGDTPKFQFLGHVLGTPHPPGYPVYTLLLAAFARLPFGTLAWRANLLSAVAAATAVSLLYLLMRRLGCRPLVAIAGALAFAFGRVLWSQATLAEVYALAALLLAALLLVTVAWGQSRNPRTLDLAVFFAALSLAHHTTVAMVAPALVVYVLVTDRRAGLAPAFLARAVGLVALGLAPYLLIVQRTLAPAAYLGARARNLGELWDVMRGATFEGRLFPFGVREVLTTRVALVGSFLVAELTWFGAALAVLGLVVLILRRRREAWLLGLAVAGLVFFGLNYDVPDLDVFLVPAFVPLFVLAAVGAEFLAQGAGQKAPAVAALVLLWPSAQLVRNFKASDHSDRTFESRYFAALFEALPPKAAIAAESYTVDQMVLYELLGEEAAHGRDVIVIPSDPESIDHAAARGYSVLAFERTRDALEAQGYPFAPVRLLDGSIDQFRKTMPRDHALLEAGLGREGRYASIGSPSAPTAVSAAPGAQAVVDVKAGELLGAWRAAVALHAESLASGAALVVDGEEVARSENGVALAMLARSGKVAAAFELDPHDALRVPFDARAFPVFRLVGPRQCVEAGAGQWVDASAEAAPGRLRLRIDDFETYDARLVVWLASPESLEPRIARSLGKGTPKLEASAFRVEDRALAAALSADGLERAHLGAAVAFTRLDLRVNDDGDFATVALDLGALPTAAWVRADVDRKAGPRALACLATPGDVNYFEPGSSSRASLRLGSDAEAMLGVGWNRAEAAGFRWSSASDAHVLLPLASADLTRVRVRAMPLARPGVTPSLRLVVNGVSLEAQELRPGWGYYEWTVAAAQWRLGTNDVVLRTSAVAVPKALGLGDDTRTLGIAISTLELRRTP